MYDVFRSLKVVLIIANSVDPDEMQHVCQRNHLGVSSIQKVNQYVPNVLLVGHKQTVQTQIKTAAFDQNLHYLLSEYSIRI